MIAEVIADSISPQGHRITTMQLRYWRGIHSELMTHRVFSRNARSSRAVPIDKMIKEVENDPFIPRHWGANQKGMQAGAECNASMDISGKVLDREEAWLLARDYAVNVAKGFAAAGYHKQLVNRLLEPFMFIDTLVTSTEWSNFFALRDHKDAEPHFRDLAGEMRTAMLMSTPRSLEPNGWHLPYVTGDDMLKILSWAEQKGKEGVPVADYDMPEIGDMMTTMMIRLSVARCARISYTPFEGDGNIDSELKRYNLLVGSHPMHASPAEHQATPDVMGGSGNWFNPQEHGNLVGWRQFRKLLTGENQ